MCYVVYSRLPHLLPHEALQDHPEGHRVRLEALLLHALAHILEASVNLEWIQERPEADIFGDLFVTKGPIEIKILVAVDRVGEVILLEHPQTLVILQETCTEKENVSRYTVASSTDQNRLREQRKYSLEFPQLKHFTHHSGFLDDPKHPKLGKDRWFACRELGQLLTVFAAQNSSGSADHEANASRWARVFGKNIRTGDCGLLGDQIPDIWSKVNGNQTGFCQPIGRFLHGIGEMHTEGNGRRLRGNGCCSSRVAHSGNREKSNRCETGNSESTVFGVTKDGLAKASSDRRSN